MVSTIPVPLRHVLAVALAGALGALCSGPPLAAQAEFDLGFSGPDSLSGPAGSVQAATYFATIEDLGSTSGAQGWSIILTADGGTITGNDIVGTDAEALLDTRELFPGFLCNFNTFQMCPEENLACSAVVLSFCEPRVLPIAATSTVARLDVEAVVPAGGGTMTLRYLDVAGCFAGVADTNVVTEAGQSRTFANGMLSQTPKDVALSPPDPVAAIGDLIEDVRALSIPRGVKAGLVAVLVAAKIVLLDEDPGNDRGAVALLFAFQVAVNALSGAVIDPADADALIASAQDIIDLLNAV